MATVSSKYGADGSLQSTVEREPVHMDNRMGHLAGYVRAYQPHAKTHSAQSQQQAFSSQPQYQQPMQYAPSQPIAKQGTSFQDQPYAQWQKEIPGFGAVPVAPGTPGAYVVNTGATNQEMLLNKQLGLTPGLAGVDFSTLWKDAKDFSNIRQNQNVNFTAGKG